MHDTLTHLYNQTMKAIKKYSFEITALVGITIAYFFTRIYNIMQLPIFTDEAIYTRWAQIAYNDAAWRFISLTDGKQPSFVWLHMVLLRFFEDPLLAGRMASVFTGFITLLGIFVLAQIVFKNLKVSILAAFIYLIYPFAMVYDRLALYESILAMFFVWVLIFQIILVRKLRLDVAMILGFVLGGGVLTKSSGFLAIYLMPFLYFLLDFNKKTFKTSVIRLTVLLVVSVVIANTMYSVLRLSPFFHIIEQKNSIFVYPVSEWVAFSMQIKIENLVSNFRGLSDWFVIYFSIPFILVVIYSFIFKSFYREKVLLLLWFLLPFLALLVFGKTLYPRYLFFMSLPLLPILAFGLYKISTVLRNKLLIGIIAIGFFAYPFYSSLMILTNFSNAPIPRSDLDQLVNGWPSGGGVRESIEFFKNESKDRKIFIGTQGTFGLMPYAYEIYLGKNPNIEIKGYWPIENNPPGEVYEKAKERDVYFVYYQPCPQCEYSGAAPITWPLEKIKEYKKGDETTSLSIYKLTGESQ